MIRFGMHFCLWAPTWTLAAGETALPEAARYGIQLVEIPLLNPDAIDVPRTRALFEANGIAPSASLCLPATAMAHRDPAAAEAFLTKALGVAHALGSSFLGGVTYSALGYTTGAPPTEAEYDNIAKALRPVARRAADLGMTLGLEPCNRYETHLLNNSDQAVSLFERIGEPNLALHLDTYHMNIEEKGFAHAIEIAGDHVPYIHMSESDRGVPGTGTVNWDQLLAALAKSDLDRDLVIESFITLPPEIAAALCVWRPVANSRYEVLQQGLSFLRARAAAHGLEAG